ncbi:MAG: 3-dehydroquinate synthase [Pseudomonadota bacterium]
MVEPVHVPLGDRAYDIQIGADLLGQAGAFVAPLLRRPKVTVVTDSTVAGLHLQRLEAGLAAEGISASALALDPGEARKGWEGLATVVEWLLDQQVARDDVVIALGGGVIGDLVGFAAAILRRGVRFVQVPTTLLAQVDSSVGGKTAINTRHGKNLVGAFHQPSLVLADITVLDTLSPRDFRAGCGEVVKYGLLGDAAFFEWLEANHVALMAGSGDARAHAVRRSCEMKAEIVARDETEQGDRALLNLGHTFCHALEAATGYSDRLLHGEGVSIGCGLAFQLSQALGLCPQEAPSRVRALTKAMGMVTDLHEIPGGLPDADALIGFMGQDKKVKDGRLTFVLAEDIGRVFTSQDVPRQVLQGVLKDALAPLG